MAAKRPIVASNLPSIREILNEKNSVLAEPDDAESLARCIKKVLQNKQLDNKISNQAFLDVQNCTWGKRAENILKMFKD